MSNNIKEKVLAVAFAIRQPDEADLNEILFTPTARSFKWQN